jgi:hypothetical protein
MLTTLIDNRRAAAHQDDRETRATMPHRCRGAADVGGGADAATPLALSARVVPTRARRPGASDLEVSASTQVDDPGVVRVFQNCTNMRS